MSVASEASQPSFEEAGGFDRLASMAVGVAWLREGNRELVVRDPQVAGHQVLVKVEACGSLSKPLCRGVGEDQESPAGDADFTVIVPQSKDAAVGKRLEALGFQVPDSARGGFWRSAPDWQDHEVANLIESVFRRAWQSPIGYQVVIERRQLTAP